jgi:hypothetical protein
MFRPKWPSLSVQFVVFQDSAAHCNAGFFRIFGYVGFTWLLPVLLGLVVVAALSALVEATVLLCAGRPFRQKHAVKQCLTKQQRTTLQIDGQKICKSELYA